MFTLWFIIYFTASIALWCCVLFIRCRVVEQVIWGNSFGVRWFQSSFNMHIFWRSLFLASDFWFVAHWFLFCRAELELPMWFTSLKSRWLPFIAFSLHKSVLSHQVRVRDQVYSRLTDEHLAGSRQIDRNRLNLVSAPGFSKYLSKGAWTLQIYGSMWHR